MDRLLVIDDNWDHGTFIARVAASIGFEVEQTDDPERFLERAADWPATVCVLDLHMPRVDGVQLLQALAARKSTARIIVSSGVDARTLETARRLGEGRGLDIAGVLPKPVRLQTLKEMLTPLLNRPQRATAEMLAAAIRAGQLTLLFQPKLHLERLALDSVEALVRWDPPGRERVAPDEFVPLAEREGLIDDLTDWVVATAVGQGAAWRAQGLDLPVAVNVSPLNLQRPDLPDRIAETCRRAELPFRNLIIEVTETATMQDPVAMMEVLTRLRIQGFGLSIDDFGTGYSSMLQLVRLPFTEIKVDRSFVMEMTRVADAAAVARATVDLGHSLGLKVTAEGIETRQAADMLRGFGCDLGQGYLYSKPVPAEAIPKLSWPGFQAPAAAVAAVAADAEVQPQAGVA